MTIVDWLARTTMLVLAALATLALIGSLASVSDSPIGNAFPGAVAPQDARPDDRAPASDELPTTTARTESSDAATPTTIATATAVRIADARDAAIARWLKALTYAVIALAAIAAAGVVALLRIGGTLSRMSGR